MKAYLGTLTAVLLAVAGAAYADEPVQLQPGVARISLIHGDVSMQRGDSGDWVAATLNTPVVPGDRVSTGASSRSEVQLDHANILRLDANSAAKIADLTRTRIQVQVSQGLLNYSVLKGSEADAEIDTPNVAIRPLKDGSYRIQVNSDSETQVIVRKGKAEITTPQGSTQLESGQLITIQGTDNPQYQTASAPRKDDWDHFNSDRDHLIRDAESWRHTGRYYTGSEDLDAYGHWERVPDYGSVWVPAQGPDWVPYRDGRWVWEPYYGWTWVSYEPWGWAPYHYGRWFLHGASWCWWPGPVFLTPAYYPVWAPAYVSFFGLSFGSHFFLGFGFGHIGWLPIGPFDGFYPWYGSRVNVVNVTNITNITNVRNVNNGGVQPVPALLRRGNGRGFSNLDLALKNPKMLRAISTMPGENFGKAPVPIHSQQAVDVATLRQSSLLSGRIPVVPTRESLRPVDRLASPPANTRLDANQRFFAKRQPAPVQKSFTEQAAQIQKMIGESSRVPLMAEAKKPSVPVPGAGQQAEKGTNTSSPGETKQATSAANGKMTPPGKPTQNQSTDRSGWHRFGENGVAQTSPEGNQRSQARSNPSANTSSKPDSHVRSDSPAPRGDGWHSFSGSKESNSNQAPTREQPPAIKRAGNSDRSRTEVSPSSMHSEQTPAATQSEWHRFSPSSPESRTEPRHSAPAERPSWQQFSSHQESSGPPQDDSSRRAPSSRDAQHSADRPPLDLRQPIVTGRSSSPAPDNRPQVEYHGSSAGSQGRPQAGNPSEHRGDTSAAGHSSPNPDPHSSNQRPH